MFKALLEAKDDRVRMGVVAVKFQGCFLDDPSHKAMNYFVPSGRTSKHQEIRSQLVTFINDGQWRCENKQTKLLRLIELFVLNLHKYFTLILNNLSTELATQLAEVAILTPSSVWTARSWLLGWGSGSEV